MRAGSSEARAPRPRPRVGAFVRSGALLWVLIVARAGDVSAQEPRDTLRPDTLGPALDSLAQVRDTTSADTIFYNLPSLEAGAPDGWRPGVWSWDHTDIMVSGANTVAELVAEVPGILTLLGGDYGTPVTLSAFGGGGGGVRVIRDGFEVVPLAGGVPDLARVGLAGIRRVRLDRSGGELLLELWTFVYDDGRPYSLVEAGTGDLDTNFFRATFTDPTAVGGSLALGMERTDTRGPRAQEPGNRTGTWVRYQLHRGDGAGIAFDLRRASTESEVPDYAGAVSRSDWTVRARTRVVEGLVAEIYAGKSTHDVDDERAPYELEGGARSQQGVRLAFSGTGSWARAAYRRFGGDGLPESRLDAAVGFTRDARGGVEARLDRAAWPDATTSAVRLRGWTDPFYGVSLFGAYESGTRGARLAPLTGSPPDTATVPDTTVVEEAALFGLTDRTTSRLGASFEWRSTALSVAWLSVEADSLLPLGLELDRGAPLLEGARHTGFEVWGRLPTLWEGLHLEGSLQQWSTTGPYLPEQIYRGALVFHRTLKESGNLELWWSLGVRGRDPMEIHSLDADPTAPAGQLVSVPFFQSWYGRIQVRIVTMQIFIAWENFSIRRNLQDFPDRVLPHTRAVYGLRWTLWN